MDITIKRLEKPYNTPLIPLIAEAVAELTAAGLYMGGEPAWDSNVFYADDENGVIVGLLDWKITEWRQEANIEFGYVRPAYRRQGIYARLFAALEAEALTLKLRSIAGYTHANNTALQAVALRQGRELVSLGYRKRLPLMTETVTQTIPQGVKLICLPSAACASPPEQP